MQLCLVEFTRPDRVTGEFFSRDFINAVSKHSIDEIILFQPTERTCPELREELKIKLPEAALRTEQLDPISSDCMVHEMKQQPWTLLRQILSKLDESQEAVFVLGRGSSLLQHLMWLSAGIRGSETLFLDAPSAAPFQAGKSEINTQISSDTLGAFAGLQAQDINNNVQDRNGWYSSNDLAEYPGAVASGVNSATQLAVENGYLVKDETKGTPKNTVYKLTPRGWPTALDGFMSTKKIENETLKDLLVSFIRLPPSREDGSVPSPNLTSHISTAGAHDGLLAVLQKHAPSVQGSHIMTLEEACEFSEGDALKIHFRRAKEILRQRSIYDSVQVKNHLVLINPSYDEHYQLEFSRHLLAALINYETEYGRHCWNFDITNPLNEIKSAVSFFANASNSPTAYMLKSEGEPGIVIEHLERSRHPRFAHKIPVPNRIALDVMKKNHKPGYQNNLVALMLLEDANSAKSDGGLPFDDVSENDYHGSKWTEIQDFVRQMKAPYDLSKGVLSGSQTRMKDLVAMKLVRRHIPSTGSSIIRYALTNEGYLVASQLYSEMKKEGMS
jgi:hypothetical protein